MLFLSANVYAAQLHELPVSTNERIGLVRIAPRTLDRERVRGITINGIVPEITGPGSEYLSEAVDEIVRSKTSNGLGTMELSYNIVRSSRHRVITIIIVAETVTPGGARSERVSTLAFDSVTFNPVQVTDLLGSNGLNIATDVVNNFIAQNFRHMPRIQPLGDDARFYVTGEAVFFLFDRYEIAPGSEGIQSVPVYTGEQHLRTYLLEADDYYIDRESHGVRMLPLRRIVEHFGYYVIWDDENLIIRLTREGINGNGTNGTNGNGGANGYIVLTLNENAFTRLQDITPRTLEAAPQIIDGMTHVPISFFEIILGMHYNISADGTIELTTYRHE